MPTEAELSIEEAVQIILSHGTEEMGGDEEHSVTNSSDPVVQVMPVALNKFIDHLHDVEMTCDM